MLIKVEHLEFGTLFAAMIAGKGRIVTTTDEEGNKIPWMTTPEILQQLRKFGFDIIYNEASSLDDHTLDVLMQTRDLGYDKINQITVVSRKDGYRQSRTYTVAFTTKDNEDLLVFGATITEATFSKRLSSGKLISLEDAADWNWLTSLYNIDDLLRENADIEEFNSSEEQDKPIQGQYTIGTDAGFTLYDETAPDDNEEIAFEGDEENTSGDNGGPTEYGASPDGEG